jgi:hypothetical protein
MTWGVAPRARALVGTSVPAHAEQRSERCSKATGSPGATLARATRVSATDRRNCLATQSDDEARAGKERMDSIQFIQFIRDVIAVRARCRVPYLWSIEREWARSGRRLPSGPPIWIDFRIERRRTTVEPSCIWEACNPDAPTASSVRCGASRSDRTTVGPIGSAIAAVLTGSSIL